MYPDTSATTAQRTTPRTTLARRFATTLVVLLTVAGGTVAGVSAFAAGGGATQSASAIDSCTVITEPGTYRVTDDFGSENESSDACITIASDDVTVVGDGHEIQGTSTRPEEGPYVGVLAEGVSNVTVRNLSLQFFSTPIRLDGVAGGTVRDVQLYAPGGNGLQLLNTSDVTVADSEIDSEGATIYLDGSSNNTVERSFLEGFERVLRINRSHDNVFRNVVAIGGEDGVVFEESSDNSVVNLSFLYVGDTEYVSDAKSVNSVEGVHFFVGQNFSFTSNGVSVGIGRSTLDTPEGSALVGEYSVRASGAENARLDLRVAYAQQDVEDAGVDEETISVFRHDGEAWSEVDGATTDTAADVASATVTDISSSGTVIALLGETDGGAENGDRSDDDDTDGDGSDDGDAVDC